MTVFNTKIVHVWALVYQGMHRNSINNSKHTGHIHTNSTLVYKGTHTNNINIRGLDSGHRHTPIVNDLMHNQLS